MTKKKTPPKGGPKKSRRTKSDKPDAGAVIMLHPSAQQLRTAKTKAEVIVALGQNLGIISRAVDAVGCSRSQYYEWLKDDKDFALMAQEVTERTLDYVEGQMFKLIEGVTVEDENHVDENGDPMIYKTIPDKSLIIFYLKTKGKARGYVERQEIGFTLAEPITGMTIK